MELTVDERAELHSLLNDRDVPANVATRARIVLWYAEGLQKKEVAARAGVSRPTVDLWISRYEAVHHPDHRDLGLVALRRKAVA